MNSRIKLRKKCLSEALGEGFRGDAALELAEKWFEWMTREDAPFTPFTPAYAGVLGFADRPAPVEFYGLADFPLNPNLLQVHGRPGYPVDIARFDEGGERREIYGLGFGASPTSGARQGTVDAATSTGNNQAIADEVDAPAPTVAQDPEICPGDGKPCGVGNHRCGTTACGVPAPTAHPPERPPVPFDTVRCRCTREFRPEFPGQKKCNPCLYRDDPTARKKLKTGPGEQL